MSSLSKDPISTFFKLKKPCSNCPFLTSGAIELNPGRLDGIIDDLKKDDRATFYCHKTVHSKSGGEFCETNGQYNASGKEAMCAGAAAYLMKMQRPSVGMRLAIAIGRVSADHWDDSFDLIIEPESVNE